MAATAITTVATPAPIASRAAHRPRPVARTRCNAVRSQRWEVRSQPQSASESQRRPDLVQRIGQTACVLALGASMAVPGESAGDWE